MYVYYINHRNVIPQYVICIQEENRRFFPESLMNEFQKLIGSKWDQDGIIYNYNKHII